MTACKELEKDGGQCPPCETMEVIVAAVIAVVGALLGYYFLESLHTARQQKLIAIRLEAHMRNWIREFFEGAAEFKPLLVLGAMWEDKLKEALSKEGPEAFVKVDDEYKKMLEDIKGRLSEDSELIENIKKTHKFIRDMDEEIFQFHIDQLKRAHNDLIENRMFISDEEAARFSWTSAHRVIEVRDHIEQLFYGVMLHLIKLRKMDTLDLKEIQEVQFENTRRIILISKHIQPLLHQATSVRENKIIMLAFINMLGRT